MVHLTKRTRPNVPVPDVVVVFGSVPVQWKGKGRQAKSCGNDEWFGGDCRWYLLALRTQKLQGRKKHLRTHLKFP